MAVNARRVLLVLTLGAILAYALHRHTAAPPPPRPEQSETRADAASAGRQGATSSSRPNLVLIIIDTLRADKLSSYGFPQQTTPHLDALAERGVRFANVIAQSSWTRPSVASLLTSRYPRSIGIYDEQDEALAPRFETLAEVLRANGYATVGATANPNINSAFGFHQGFDHHIDSDVLFKWMKPEPGKVSQDQHPMPKAHEVFGRVLDWIAEKDRTPCYVQVTVMEVHEHWRLRFEHLDPNLFRSDPRQAAFWWQAQRAKPDSFHGDHDQSYLKGVYEASRQIGRFTELLSRMRGWENTLFVITSDHGEGLSSHPGVPDSLTHGYLLYESQLHVPLILYSTTDDLPRGLVVEDRVRLMDLMPTLLEYLGVVGPEQMKGVSLMPLLRAPAQTADLPTHFFVETEYRTVNKVGVYTDEWKYIENHDDHPYLEPYELQRVGIPENGPATDQSKRHPAVRQELAQWLQSWQEAHAKAAPTATDRELSPQEAEQLRALGYGE